MPNRRISPKPSIRAVHTIKNDGVSDVHCNLKESGIRFPEYYQLANAFWLFVPIFPAIYEWVDIFFENYTSAV